MKEKLLDLLACPTCREELACSAREVDGEGEIVFGELSCARCIRVFPILDGIPRFVPADNYAASFGLQWNRFKVEQLDSANQTRLSEDRFYSETGWTEDSMKGKWLLEAGCGAGRFLEVASRIEAEVVGMDLSNSVDAVRQTLSRKNVHLVQASIYEPPFRPGAFDGCYCIGVIQHTPDPARTLSSLPALLKPGGRLAVTIYERRRCTMLYSKYWARKITRHMSSRVLLSSLKILLPIAFPITEILFRIPVAGKFFQFVIPVANYVDNPELTLQQRYRWSLLDTFDMLAPAYDQPMTLGEVEAALQGADLTNLRRLSNPGLNLIAERPFIAADDECSSRKDRAATGPEA
jgi:uncharacterized protein YbaR (Trm112 family)